MNSKLNVNMVNEFIKECKEISEYDIKTLKFSVMGFDFNLECIRLENGGYSIDLNYLEDNGIYYDYMDQYTFKDFKELGYINDLLKIKFKSLKKELKKIMLDNTN